MGVKDRNNPVFAHKDHIIIPVISKNIRIGLRKITDWLECNWDWGNTKNNLGQISNFGQILTTRRQFQKVTHDSLSFVYLETPTHRIKPLKKI